MHDINIQSQLNSDGTSSAPTAFVSYKSWPEPREVKISISHDGDYATAVCLAAEDSAFSLPTNSLKTLDSSTSASGTDEKIVFFNNKDKTRSQKAQKKKSLRKGRGDKGTDSTYDLF